MCFVAQGDLCPGTSTAAKGPRFQLVSPRPQDAVTATTTQSAEQSRFAGRLGGTGRPITMKRQVPRPGSQTPAASESPRGALQIDHCTPSQRCGFSMAGWSSGISISNKFPGSTDSTGTHFENQLPTPPPRLPLWRP